MATGRNSNEAYIKRFRERVQATNLEKKLMAFLEGEEDMTHLQVQVAFNLLDRVVPKISASSIEVKDHRTKAPREMSLREIQDEWQDLQAANG